MTESSSTIPAQESLRPPAEVRYARELHALASNDKGSRPANWNLSPRSVVRFIAGSKGQSIAHEWQGAPCETVITKKFYGEVALIQRCVVSLLGNRGLLLIGEPGTAKSMLSELLCAAVCGVSTRTIQGSAGTSAEQIKYSWNYADLLANGPSLRAMVRAPLYDAMASGSLLRFEEITRCPPEIQDVLISVMSDKILSVPELDPPNNHLLANTGFNIIATANTRDRGVHEMSSALKRRFNFETIHPIASAREELDLVVQQVQRTLTESEIDTPVDEELMALLVECFRDLRQGKTREGAQVDRPSAIMSSAEAVSVGVAALMEAYYFDGAKAGPEHVVGQILGTAMKDASDDAQKLKQYFDVVVKKRAARDPKWKEFYDAKRRI